MIQYNAASVVQCSTQWMITISTAAGKQLQQCTCAEDNNTNNDMIATFKQYIYIFH